MAHVHPAHSMDVFAICHRHILSFKKGKGDAIFRFLYFGKEHQA
jgi:hypothetical protein